MSPYIPEEGMVQGSPRPHGRPTAIRHSIIHRVFLSSGPPIRDSHPSPFLSFLPGEPGLGQASASPTPTRPLSCISTCAAHFSFSDTCDDSRVNQGVAAFFPTSLVGDPRNATFPGDPGVASSLKCWDWREMSEGVLEWREVGKGAP